MKGMNIQVLAWSIASAGDVNKIAGLRALVRISWRRRNRRGQSRLYTSAEIPEPDSPDRKSQSARIDSARDFLR